MEESPPLAEAAFDISNFMGLVRSAAGCTKPAADRNAGEDLPGATAGRRRAGVQSGIQAIEEVSGAVRRTLRDLVHNRKKAWPLKHFPPGLLTERFAGPIAPELTHRERLWPGPA